MLSSLIYIHLIKNGRLKQIILIIASGLCDGQKSGFHSWYTIYFSRLLGGFYGCAGKWPSNERERTKSTRIFIILNQYGTLRGKGNLWQGSEWRLFWIFQFLTEICFRIGNDVNFKQRWREKEGEKENQRMKTFIIYWTRLRLINVPFYLILFQLFIE